MDSTDTDKDDKKSRIDRESTSAGMMRAPEASAIDTTTVSLHAHVLGRIRDAQRDLLATRGLAPLITYLLDDLPAAFGAAGAELKLHDPEGDLGKALQARGPTPESFSLHKDSSAIHQLFDDAPAVTYLTLDDPRMFRVLAGERDATGVVLMPLVDGNHLIGVYLLGLQEDTSAFGERDLELFAMLGQLVAAAILRVVEHQRSDQLALLDEVTEVGNQRAFTRDLLRELQWARRSGTALSLIMVCLDEIDEIARSYGEIAGNFVQRRVSQRLCSDLRATDYIARLTQRQFGVILPACTEPNAYEIAERLRQDIDDFPIDDGRGSVLYVTLSVGVVSWDPTRHPVEGNERLAAQFRDEAEAAMSKSLRGGGNRVSVARLGLLMV